MHKLKFFVCIFLASLLMVSPSFALDTDKSETESVSLVAYNNLTASFNGYTRDGEYIVDYPDYYGGAYIDENGKLIVLVTDRKLSTKREIRDLTQSIDISIKHVNTSLRELLDLQVDISEKMTSVARDVLNSPDKVDENLLALIDSFVGIGVSEKNNNLFIELANDTPEIREAFYKYISKHEKIDFRCFSTDIQAEDNATIAQAGSQTRGIHYQGSACSFSGESGSMAYRARYNGANGFVTAGHCVYGVGDDIGIGETTFYQVQGALDVAFIELHEGETVSYMTAYGDVMSGYICDVAEDSTVYFSGRHGRLVGTVVCTNYIGATDEFLTSFSDMLRIVYSNGTTYAGDSGGLVYAYYGSSAYRAVGVHHGTPRVLSGSVATKATRISSIAGITAY